jgi:rod shape-determining protein MreD
MSKPLPRLGNMPSRTRLIAIPVLSIVLGSSIGTLLPIISQFPSLPPFGLLVLLAWRLLHAELLPLWIGVPLGAIDDIMTGQPLGTAMFLWSVILIGIEIFDQRIMWRDYMHDWLLVAGAITFVIISAMVFANLGGSQTRLTLVLPQILWSALAYPLIVRLIARLDRWRIMA